MARYTLNIETNDDTELSDILRRLGGGPAPVDASGQSAASRPARAKRSGSDGSGSATDATTASPATELPTPGEQQTVEQTKATDPSLAAAQNGDENGPLKDPEVLLQPVEDVKPTPAAAAPGDITYDMLKDAMTALLSKVNAKAAQDLVVQHGAGAKGLSELKPEQYAAVHAALIAAVA